MRRGASAVGALLVCSALVGCAPRTLRTEVLERRLASDMSDRLEVDGISVACPSSIEVRRGDRFVCTATAPNGDRLRIVVTQIDDIGSVTWETDGSAG